jgi:hypothetical protein
MARPMHWMFGIVAAAAAIFISVVSLASNQKCGTAYVGFLDQLTERAQFLPPEKLVAIHRKALRIYDACETGHLQTFEPLFKELEDT